jgi:hypothetical protein
MRRCRVCNHVERTRIELDLAGGVRQRVVARNYHLSEDSVQRHWRHVDPERKARLLVGPVQRAALAARICEENSNVLDNLRVIRAGLYESLDRAHTAGDTWSVGMLSGRLHENLRDTARITGELASSPLVQNNTNIFMHPAVARVEAIIVAALADHPAARADVIRALRAAEASEEPALPVIEHEGAHADIA